jgi:hypothetical protein
MKTLTRNALSLYVVPDNTPIVLGDTTIEVGAPLGFVIGDCSVNDTVLHENVTPPDDWVGGKYFYKDTAWELNPAWEEPDATTGTE